MNFTELIGYFAALVTMIASLPQLIKIVVSKSADDVSLLMFFFYAVGSMSWFIYGFGVGAMPIMVTNVATFSISVAIIVLKKVYATKKVCVKV